jgi:uncharacterized membrane protein YgaE (UPF0421/DUF939 family)
MKILIRETNTIEIITVIDYRTKLDYSNDFIGNNESDLHWDDDNNIIMTQDQFDYWEIACKKQQRIEDILQNLHGIVSDYDFYNLEEQLSYLDNLDLEHTQDQKLHLLIEYSKDAITAFAEEKDNYKRLSNEINTSILSIKLIKNSLDSMPEA